MALWSLCRGSGELTGGVEGSQKKGSPLSEAVGVVWKRLVVGMILLVDRRSLHVLKIGKLGGGRLKQCRAVSIVCRDHLCS